MAPVYKDFGHKKEIIFRCSRCDKVVEEVIINLRRNHNNP